jgi:hypothetical protein
MLGKIKFSLLGNNGTVRGYFFVGRLKERIAWQCRMK